MVKVMSEVKLQSTLVNVEYKIFLMVAPISHIRRKAIFNHLWRGKVRLAKYRMSFEHARFRYSAKVNPGLPKKALKENKLASPHLEIGVTPLALCNIT